jgi:hypothetical protein
LGLQRGRQQLKPMLLGACRFELDRYLTVWVLLCMVVGVVLGKALPGVTAALSRLEFGQGSQVNVPIGILLWLMIYPMMLKVDFGAVGGSAGNGSRGPRRGAGDAVGVQRV